MEPLDATQFNPIVEMHAGLMIDIIEAKVRRLTEHLNNFREVNVLNCWGASDKARTAYDSALLKFNQSTD